MTALARASRPLRPVLAAAALVLWALGAPARTAEPRQDAPRSAAGAARGLVLAEGGGSAGADWAGEAARRMVAHARERLGLAPDEPCRVAVLGGEGRSMGERFAELGGVVVQSVGDARDAGELETLRAAHVVWIVGGDQSRYVASWDDGPVEEALVELWRAGGAVGGTSAGCAVLGELVYDARNGSLDEREALADAFHEDLTLDEDFLPLVPGVLFDTHFTERGRLARLATILARLVAQDRDVLCVGVDDRTALVVDGAGRAEVIGEGAVTFLFADRRTRARTREGRPPLLSAARHEQLVAGYVFDLVERRVVTRPERARSGGFEARPLEVPRGLAPIDGSDPAAAELGEFVVVGTDERDALIAGRLSTRAGTGRLAGAIVVPRAFSDPDLDEARVGGGQWALCRHPGRVVLWLDESIALERAGRSSLRVVARGDGAGRSLLVLDGRAVSATCTSDAPARGDAERRRGSVALEGARLHLVPPGESLDLR